jgi:hypothetical protein
MTAFIKKENLGSGPAPKRILKPQHPQAILNMVEKTRVFQQTQSNLAQAKAERAEQLKDKWDGNAEVQRWRTQMTPEERTRDAIDRMVPTTRAVEEMRSGGKEVSYETARGKAEELAYKAERQKKGE